ncbi:MAG: Ig-like domain-containing protein [Thermomicrobiales bacterium]
MGSTVPGQGDVSVAAGSNLTITFTEPVEVTGDWITITCGTETFNPTGSNGATTISVNSSGDPVYSLDPAADLPGGETCTVTITADDVSDDDAVDPPDTLDGNENSTSEGSPTDDYSISFGVAPVAVDDSYGSTGNVGIVVDAANGVILGTGADEGTGLSVSEVQGSAANVGNGAATTQGGSVTLDSDGSFSYDPPAGYSGDDTFSYRVSGPSGTSNTATVTVSVSSDLIWFIDSSSTGSNQGTLANPFTSIASFMSNATDSAGETIFIATGSGYTSGITLLDSQKLVGQAAGASLESISGITFAPFSRTLPSTGGTAPALATSSGNAVDLATANTVRGLDIGNTAGTGLNGAEVGTLVVREVGISGTGGGVDLRSTTGAAIDVVLDNLSASSSADEGVLLDGVSGSFSVTATTGALNISNATAVDIDGASSVNRVNLNLTFASITASGGSNGMAFNDASGSFTVSGIVDVDNTTGDGIAIDDSPATFDFQGTTSIDNTGINGIDLTGFSNGQITFSSIDLDTIGSVGLRIQNNNNPVSINGGSIGATNDPGGNAVDIDGGNANVTVAASVTKTTGGEAVDVTSKLGGITTFSGAIACNGTYTGISVSNNGGGEEHFTATVTVSTGIRRASTSSATPGATWFALAWT